MKKTEQNIWKELTERTAPIIATLGSVVALVYFYITLVNVPGQFISILTALFATIIGVFVSASILKILRKKREGNVFISYQHKDKKFVERIIQSLKFKRFNIFYDEDVVRIGDNIKDTILDNIKKSDVVIVVLPKDNNEDNFLNYELKVAIEHKKKILPIIIDPETNIPSELKNLKYADFAKEYDDNMRQLTKALVTALEEKKSGT